MYGNSIMCIALRYDDKTDVNDFVVFIVVGNKGANSSLIIIPVKGLNLILNNEHMIFMKNQLQPKLRQIIIIIFFPCNIHLASWPITNEKLLQNHDIRRKLYSKKKFYGRSNCTVSCQYFSPFLT